jgi:asparagine synthase (glutamine-hydrolysing)
MCGIAGIIGTNSNKRVQEMLSLLKHRGPDATGIWKSNRELSLGHVRLSINDLSEAGNQPMFSEDRSVVLVANGEIYNYLELRKELESKGIKFNSNSDSEVIIHAWKTWKHKCFQMFNGMFAFALFNHEKNELILARDRMGIKPLYYSELNNEFIFSSEIKSIVAVMKSKSEIDPISLNQYLTYQNYFGQRSLYKGIKLLLPGHYLTIQLDQRKKLEPFCSFNFTKDLNIDFDQAVTKYKDVISSSVQRHLLSDVPVASYLSAGFDSSTVLNRASINRIPPDSFTGTFQEGGWYDETSTASKIAKYNGSAFNAVNIVPENLPEMMDHLMDALDEPRMGIGAFSQYCVAKKVAKTHKVILTGHGGDELFSGYPVFKFVNLIDKIKKNPFNLYKLISKNFFNELPHMIYFGLNLFKSQTYQQYLPVLNNPIILQQGLKPEWAKLIQHHHPEDELVELDGNCNNQEDVVLNHYLQAYLNGLLVVEDKISMAHSLESRTPFLDNEMLELSLSVPQSLKLYNGNLKAIVKEGGKDWLPEILYNEPKRGFPTPLNKWLRGPLREWFINKMTSEQSGLHTLFKSEWLKQTCNQYLNSYKKNIRPLDEIQTQRMWQLLSLESWLRKNKLS